MYPAFPLLFILSFPYKTKYLNLTVNLKNPKNVSFILGKSYILSNYNSKF